MKRRTVIVAGIAGLAVLGAGAYLIKPKEKGSEYSPYFNNLNGKLKAYKRAIPSLVIDLDILDKNIEKLLQIIPDKADYRVVVKSLPSRQLVEYVMQKARTKKLMVFHQPFLSDIAQSADIETDILIGKPFPVQTCAYYYSTLSGNETFDSSSQLQWLIDTNERLEQYLALARKKSLHLRVNLEIDVGLRRGGFKNPESLSAALSTIENNKEYLTFSGFMGYDPHVASVPAILLSRRKAFKQADDFYASSIALLKEKHPALYHDNLTFNGAGSPTIALHKQYGSVLNDLSAGSCLVKPTDFDKDTLDGFEPAAFIATPVLKKFEKTEIPALEKYKNVLSAWNPNWKQSFFIYGGSWMANYYQPEGISENPLFGKSTNQVMINASEKVKLEVDDFVFLRPHQSEFVFLQFGNMITLRNGEIAGTWDLLNQV
jgi:D-serine deaminase-like pyridoxal phosphate-dependent protein